MEQFNKVISFVLGLVVVAIFLAVATGKINLKGKLFPFSSGASSSKSVTPSPTKAPTTTSKLNQTSGTTQTTKGGIPVSTNTPNYHSYSSVGNVSNIPSTGPELLIPIAVSAFVGGSFLRKTGKKA